MNGLHFSANQLLDCWADEDRKRYARTRKEIESEHGTAYAATAAAVAEWAIKNYRIKGWLPDWRREWIERAIGE